MTGRVVIRNILSLTVLKAATALLPLVAVPYVVRIIGVEKFGLISFAEVLISFFVLFTDYGSSLSAPRDIAVNRDDREKVSRIFSSLMALKTVFLIIALMVLVVILALVPEYLREWQVYVFTFGLVLGSVLFPVWYFQGMERMEFVTGITVISKILAVVAIFLFVREPSDYLYVPLIYSVFSVIAGFIACVTCMRIFGVKFRFPDAEAIREQLREGWHIFVTQGVSSLYNSTNILVLGLFTNNALVGVYAGAEKIIKAFLQLIIPILFGIYPHVSRLVERSRKRAVSLIRTVMALWSLFSFLMSVSLFVLAGEIVALYLGDEFAGSVTVLKILAFLPLIIGMSNIMAILVILPFRLQELLPNIVVATSILNFVLLAVLVPELGANGAATSWLIAEIFSTSIGAYVVISKKLLF